MKLWGDYWESVAKKHLKKHKLKPIQSNFRSRFGEIDLIMLEQELLVFVEVKYRKDDSWMSGEQAVTRSKQNKLIKTAEYFLIKNQQHKDRNCRFDVVSIVGEKKDFKLNWIKNAFYPHN